MIPLLYIGIIIFVVAIIGFLWILFGNAFNKPDILCDLIEERADGGVVVLLANYGIKFIKKDDKIEKMKIMKTKIPAFTPVDKEFFIACLRKRIDKVYLFRDKDNVIHPMYFDEDKLMRTKIIKPFYRDLIDWMIYEYEQLMKVREQKNKWEQYIPHIAIVFSVMLVIASIVLTFQYVKGEAGKIEVVCNNPGGIQSPATTGTSTSSSSTGGTTVNIIPTS
jgi:hypothetical protein